MQKLRDVYLASPVEGATLQGLVNSELAAKKKKGTEALFWLTRSGPAPSRPAAANVARALEFTSESIAHSLENADAELTNSFTTMYQTTLKPYHTWLMSKGFQAGLQTVPYRKDFFPKLGGRPGQGQRAGQGVARGRGPRAQGAEAVHRLQEGRTWG